MLWKLISLGTGAIAGLLAERVVAQLWSAASHHEPPRNPADRRFSWTQAIAWGAAVGVGAGVTRVVANRSAAMVWEAAMHEAPPGVPSLGAP